MTNVSMQSRSGESTAVSSSAIEQFKAQLTGDLLRPGDGDYDAARTIWNAMINRRPALIARCKGAEDVAVSVAFARSNDLLLSVRGGGHNIAGYAVADDALMIDLSQMNAVHVDPDARTALVEAGAIWADVDAATQAHGLAVPNGVVSTTGVAGLTLGGGIGRLSRKHGLTIDNLLSVDLVIADGSLVTTSADQHADLFWGIRGGGGNFGIATRFEFKLHPVGPEVLFGPIVYRLEDAREALANYVKFTNVAPRECSVWADLLTAPPLPFLPEHVHGTTVLFVVPFYAGDPAVGEGVLAPLRSHGQPVGDGVAKIPHTQAQQAIDELYAAGASNYWKSSNFAELSDATLDAIVEHARRLPTPASDILISHLGGAAQDVAADETAYAHRDANFLVTSGARWDGPGRNDSAIEWVRGCFDAIAPDAIGGSYANFISEASGREQDAFAANYQRLVDLKRKYDPKNLFRLNQNVGPAA